MSDFHCITDLPCDSINMEEKYRPAFCFAYSSERGTILMRSSALDRKVLIKKCRVLMYENVTKRKWT